MNCKSMGKKLKSYRAKCGWSLKECSERIGISTRYLADIERGDKVPKLETFLLILNTLNASADDVLQDSLVVGYEAKSNDMIRKLNALDVTKRKQALEIFDSVISSLKE
ncbi:MULTISPECIES: helix-turn-helix domain-containing protein [Anaerotruncus]|mgnify:FL=1|nr:helix-turn-helix transcriptional regulator [Anaerotruncus massiliensis (ex Togo et al. 2019)]MBC3939488.1 helix-turn-helix transcriptional regulator [Anaerotruncus massiliensis (ex Togo et al. 2019)]